MDHLGKLDVIGSDGYGAVLVSDGLAHLLYEGNEVLPIVLGVLALDAALIGVMYSSYVDAHIAASQK